MKLRFMFLALALVAAVAFASAEQNDAARTMMEGARKKEVIDGDLKGAIQQYKTVAEKYKTDRPVAADALVRMAECYQKLGDVGAQHKIYERIVREFSDQKEPVTLARARLGGGEAERAGLDRSLTLRKIWDGDISGTISQDGRRLSYNDWGSGSVAVRNLEDSTNRQVSAGGDSGLQSAMSRDGAQVAYKRYNDETLRAELRVASSQGGSGTPTRVLFASDDVIDVVPMDWSPDGKTIAVSLRRGDQTAQIGLVTVPDGSLRVLKSVDWRGPTRIFFSPSGRHIGLDLPASDTSDQRDVFVLAVDGSREAAAVRHPSQDIMMGWTPDGGYLLFASDRQEGSMGLWALPMVDGKPRGTPELVKSSIGTGWSLGVTSSGALYMGSRAGDADVAVVSMDMATGTPAGPLAKPIQSFVGSNNQPHWSADGKQLAYVSARGFNPSSNTDRIIAIQSLATGDVREIRPRLSYFNQYSWSPDGRAFAAGGTNLKGRSGVFRIDAQTGDVTLLVDLTPVGNGSFPQWSPDGNRIYYRRGQPGSTDAAVVERELATGREREVIGSGFGGGPANVSPDGRWIVMEKTDPSARSTTIVLIPIAGGETRELLRAAQPARFASYQGMPWTPDGRAFLVRKMVQRTSEIWLVPITGELPRKLDVDTSQWSPGPVGALSLHPDGRQLAFLLLSRLAGTQVWVLENFIPALKATR